MSWFYSARESRHRSWLCMIDTACRTGFWVRRTVKPASKRGDDRCKPLMKGFTPVRENNTPINAHLGL